MGALAPAVPSSGVRVTHAQQAGGPIPLVAGDEVLGGEWSTSSRSTWREWSWTYYGGLRRTIDTCRPAIFAEIDETTSDGFYALVDELGYVVVDRVDYGYEGVEKLMIVPSEQN